MDHGLMQSIATVLVTIAFAGVCWWAFHPSRRERFEDDARLPFLDEDEEMHQRSGKENE